MAETVRLSINGRALAVTPGTTIAAAILIGNGPAFRRSITGEPRGPLCGMGICFECRAMVNGQLHRRTCQTLVCDGMEVVTDAV
jgi:sarcosine oxidase subunit alpha